MSTPEKVRRDWRMPDELWPRRVPLLPPWKPHPLGCHRPSSMTAGPWMPSALSCGRGVSGTP
jgi:hypothetical protein